MSRPAGAEGRKSTKRIKPPRCRSTIWASISIISNNPPPLRSSIPRLEETDHPSDAPTMVAGLDERSRRMMAEAESRARDQGSDRARARIGSLVRRRSRHGPRGDQNRRVGPGVRAHGADAPRARRSRSATSATRAQIARIFRRAGTRPRRPGFHLEVARHQLRQHRLGSGPARQRLGDRRHRRAAARRR